MDFSSANSRFAVQNDGPHLPQITRETCAIKETNIAKVISFGQLIVDQQNYFSDASKKPPT
jgi:hypothetical protein